MNTKKNKTKKYTKKNKNKLKGSRFTVSKMIKSMHESDDQLSIPKKESFLFESPNYNYNSRKTIKQMTIENKIDESNYKKLNLLAEESRKIAKKLDSYHSNKMKKIY